MECIIEIISKNNQFYFDRKEINLPIKEILVSKLYYLQGELTKEDIQKSVELLFRDLVVEDYKLHFIKSKETGKKKIPLKRRFKKWEVEVFYKKEVTDPASSYILKALKDIDISAENVKTGKRYLIKGNLNFSEIQLFAKRYLGNLIVQDILITKLN